MRCGCYWIGPLVELGIHILGMYILVGYILCRGNLLCLGANLGNVMEIAVYYWTKVYRKWLTTL